MATTWTLISINKHGNSISATVQEVVNGVAGRIYTSDRYHVDRGKAIILADLRAKVKADRLQQRNDKAVTAAVDLTAFEGSIK